MAEHVLSFEKLLSQYPLPQFFAETFGRKSLYIPSSVERVQDIFSWDVVNDLLQRHRFEPPRFRLEQQGKLPRDLSVVTRHPRYGNRLVPQIDVSRLYAALQSGATLVIEAVDELHPPLG